MVGYNTMDGQKRKKTEKKQKKRVGYRVAAQLKNFGAKSSSDSPGKVKSESFLNGHSASVRGSRLRCCQLWRRVVAGAGG